MNFTARPGASPFLFSELPQEGAKDAETISFVNVAPLGG
jgi:hypothetical protein